MGLKCSLLGHRYGDREVVEEREEDGSEIVIVTREVERCDRCQRTSVVSESKEVTTVEVQTAEGGADTVVGTSGGDVTDEVGHETETDRGVDAAVTMAEPPTDETRDDGVILEDEPTPRAHGEWPNSGRERDDDEREPALERTDWPDVSGEDEGFAAVTGDDEDVDVTFTGLTPEVRSEERSDAEIVETTNEGARDDLSTETVSPGEIERAGGQSAASGEASEATEDPGFVRAGSITAPHEPGRDDVQTEYYCPRCGEVRESDRSSLRAGDVCPSCRGGYLAERELD